MGLGSALTSDSPCESSTNQVSPRSPRYLSQGGANGAIKNSWQPFPRQRKCKTGACVYLKLLAWDSFLVDKDYLVYSSIQMMDKALYNINQTLWGWGARVSVNNFLQAKHIPPRLDGIHLFHSFKLTCSNIKQLQKLRDKNWCSRHMSQSF